MTLKRELRDLISEECDYRLSDDVMDRFLGLMTEIHLKDNEPLIPYGKLDSNVYVVSSGIMRYAYFDGLNEKTFGFAAPGTMIISYRSFYSRKPSFFQIESCGRSVVMKISKSDFDELTEQSNDFAKWMLRLSSAQLAHYEMKLDVFNGTAKDRFESLIRNRPDIIKIVSKKIIASYIGITPSYLSRLKKQLYPDAG